MRRWTSGRVHSGKGLRLAVFLLVLGCSTGPLSLLLPSALRTCVLAQVNVRIGDRAKSSLSDADGRMILQATNELLAQYEELLRGMIDPRERRFDREKAQRFERLFTLNAKIVNDLRQVPQAYPIGVRTYLELIEESFADEGLRVALNGAVIAAVELDEETGRYAIDLRVSKTNRNFLNQAGDLAQGTRNHALKFAVTMRRGQPETARIGAISLPKAVIAGDYARYIGVGGFVGHSELDFTPAGWLSRPEISGNYALSSDLVYGGEAYFRSNFFLPAAAARKDLFFLARLGITRSSWTAELSDYAASGTVPATGELPSGLVFSDLDRTVTDLSATENLDILQAHGGIGLSYRIGVGERTAFFLEAEYLPAFALSTGGQLTGSGTYHLGKSVVLPDGSVFNFSTMDDGTFRPDSEFTERYAIGRQEFSAVTEPDFEMVHALQFSLTLCTDLAPASSVFGLSLGGCYRLPLAGGLKQQNVGNDEQPFLLPRSVQGGLIGRFEEMPRAAVYGVWLSVYRKRRWR